MNKTVVTMHNGEFVGKLAPYGYIKDLRDKHKFLTDFLNDNDILIPKRVFKS